MTIREDMNGQLAEIDFEVGVSQVRLHPVVLVVVRAVDLVQRRMR